MSDLSAQNAEAIEAGTSVPGGITAATSIAMPGNVTVAIKKVTGLRGRSYRGRIYHCGLVQSQVAAQSLTTGVATTLRNAYLPLLTYPWTDTGWAHVVVSKYTNNAPRVTGVTTLVTDFTVNNQIDSQRRRLHARGQ